MPYKTMEQKKAIRKETGELLTVVYIDRHPAEGMRYEILESTARPGYGEIVYEWELSFDPFDIAEIWGEGY